MGVEATPQLAPKLSHIHAEFKMNQVVRIHHHRLKFPLKLIWLPDKIRVLQHENIECP